MFAVLLVVGVLTWLLAIGAGAVWEHRHPS